MRHPCALGVASDVGQFGLLGAAPTLVLHPAHPSPLGVLPFAPGLTPKNRQDPLDPAIGGQPLPLWLQLQLPEEGPILLEERI